MTSTHQITKQINQEADRLLPKLRSKQKTLQWATLGPLLLTKMVKRFALSHYAQPAKLVNVLDHWSLGKDFWDPEKAEEIISDCEKAYCATFFTGTLRMNGFDTEQSLPKGSAIEYFAKRFGVL